MKKSELEIKYSFRNLLPNHPQIDKICELAEKTGITTREKINSIVTEILIDPERPVEQFFPSIEIVKNPSKEPLNFISNRYNPPRRSPRSYGPAYDDPFFDTPVIPDPDEIPKKEPIAPVELRFRNDNLPFPSQPFPPNTFNYKI